MRNEDQELRPWMWIVLIFIAILIAINFETIMNLFIENISFLITTIGEWIRITVEELIKVMNS